jgi:hypothetical protein
MRGHLPSLLNPKTGENILSGCKAATAIANCRPHARITEAHYIGMSIAREINDESGMRSHLPSLLNPKTGENILSGCKAATA